MKLVILYLEIFLYMLAKYMDSIEDLKINLGGS